LTFFAFFGENHFHFPASCRPNDRQRRKRAWFRPKDYSIDGPIKGFRFAFLLAPVFFMPYTLSIKSGFLSNQKFFPRISLMDFSFFIDWALYAADLIGGCAGSILAGWI
jgi:hypothetical protein